MIAETKPLVEINQLAIQVLYRELGVINTVRFLRQYTTGFGDYTAERRVLFETKSLDELVDVIKRQPLKPD